MGRLKAVGSQLTSLAPMLGYLPQAEAGSSAERSIFAPWRRWYGSARWRALRMVVFARDGFTCQWPGCGRIEPSPAKLVADHRTPHRGDETLFWDEANLQTLCKPCHDTHKQRLERNGRY